MSKPFTTAVHVIAAEPCFAQKSFGDLQEEGEEDNLQKLEVEDIGDIEVESNNLVLLSDASLMQSSSGGCGGVAECPDGVVPEGQASKAPRPKKKTAKSGLQQQVS